MGITFNPLLFSGLQYTGGGGGYAGYKAPVPTASALPTSGNTNGDVRVALDTDHLWVWNSGSARWVDSGLTATAVGSSPNSDGYSLSPDNSQPNLTYQDLVLQPANASNPGVVTSGAQTFGGNKTFANTVNISTLTPSTPVKTDGSDNLISAAINLASSDVTGILPIANGGTNSPTALNNNRVMISSTGSIVENNAITANQALISNAGGLPIASVTTATELSYVSGVTSAIQTQLNGKASTALNNLASTAVNVALNMNSHQINNVTDPSNPQDAMTLNYATNTYIPLTQKAATNGVATLDSSGKIPVAQLPSVVLEYQGAWNPSTNTPTLQDSTGTNGYVYYVSTAFSGTISGLTDPSMTNFQVGDLVIYSSAIGKWQLTTPAAGVQSVNGAQGVVIVNAINQLTGDVTAGPASQSQSVISTLATVNSSPGTYGSSTAIPTLTVNGKGLTTLVSTNAVIAPAGTLTGATLASNVVNSTIENLGIQNAALNMGNNNITNANNVTVNTNIGGTTWEIFGVDGHVSFDNNAISSNGSGVLTASSLVGTSYTSAGVLVNSSTGVITSDTLTNGQVLIGSTGAAPVASTLTAGSGISIANAAGSITISDSTVVPGDISQTAFTIANNQSSASSVTGLAFSNATVRSAEVQYSIAISATTSLYEEGRLYLVQNASGWNWSQMANFDNSQVIFSVTTGGQVQYTSPTYTGYTTGKMQFRALVTGV